MRIFLLQFAPCVRRDRRLSSIISLDALLLCEGGTLLHRVFGFLCTPSRYDRGLALRSLQWLKPKRKTQNFVGLPFVSVCLGDLERKK